MICQNCGKKMESGEKFCTNCGQKLDTLETNEEKNTVEISKQPEENLTENEVKEVENNTTIIKEEKTKKKINKTPFIIIAVVLVAILAALLIIKFIVSSPKNLFFKGINEAYSNISEKFDNDITEENKYKDKVVTLKSSTTFDLNGNKYYLDSSVISIFDLLNQIKLELNETMDYKNSNFDMDLILSNDSDKLAIETNKRENDIYFKLVDIYDKYISVPFKVSTNVTSKEDLDYVTKSLKDIFLKSLDNSKFVSESATSIINEEELELNKISYEIDSNEADRIIKNIIEEMKKDDKLIEILSNNSNISKEEFISTLDSAIENLDTTSMDKVIISVYTKGILNEVISYDIYVKSENKSFKIAFSDYKDVEEIKISLNEMTMITLSTKKVKDNEYETTIKSLTATAKINTTTTDEKTTMLITLDELSSKIDFDGKIEYTNKNDAGNIDMSFKLNINENEILDLNMNTKYEISLNGTLKQIDSNDTVSEVDQETFSEIMTNLQSNKFLVSIMNTLMGY